MTVNQPSYVIPPVHLPSPQQSALTTVAEGNSSSLRQQPRRATVAAGGLHGRRERAMDVVFNNNHSRG
jgi:hypothetical protein